jgi:hypothetical protein
MALRPEESSCCPPSLGSSICRKRFGRALGGGPRGVRGAGGVVRVAWSGIRVSGTPQRGLFMAASVATSSFPLAGSAFALWNLRMASARVVPVGASDDSLGMGPQAEDTSDQPYRDKNLCGREIHPNPEADSHQGFSRAGVCPDPQTV